MVYIFDSALEEAAITEKLSRFHALIQLPGEVAQPELNNWGKRTLAYPIKKHDTGYYVIAKFETSGDKLPSLSAPSSWTKACSASSSCWPRMPSQLPSPWSRRMATRRTTNETDAEGLSDL